MKHANLVEKTNRYSADLEFTLNLKNGKIQYFIYVKGTIKLKI